MLHESGKSFVGGNAKVCGKAKQHLESVEEREAVRRVYYWWNPSACKKKREAEHMEKMEAEPAG